MKTFKEYIKLGFGFYIGYNIAKTLDSIFGTIYNDVKKSGDEEDNKSTKEEK